MKRSYSKHKRSPIQITRDILKHLDENDNTTEEQQGLSVTSLMYLSRITNSYAFYGKIKPLVLSQYIYSPEQNRYKITEKGREWLKHIDMVLLTYENQISNNNKSSNKVK